MKALACFMALLFFSNSVFSQATPRTGKVMQFGGIQKAWHQSTGKWLSLNDFWLAYAHEKGGLSWGVRSNYPPYDEVKEFDTMLIQTPDGQCLMEFFHKRWRRANDVRRWDDAFNVYSGCATVFDY